jgi:translocator protein
MATVDSNPVRSLAGNLAAFVLPPLLLNGMIFGLGWNTNSAPNPYLPPGWVVGTIWMVLFAAMGIARWLVVGNAEHRHAKRVAILGLLCLIYPLYTLGLSSLTIGLAGGILTGLYAIWIMPGLLRVSRAAAALIGLVAAWLIYASVQLSRSMHRPGA